MNCAIHMNFLSLPHQTVNASLISYHTHPLLDKLHNYTILNHQSKQFLGFKKQLKYWCKSEKIPADTYISAMGRYQSIISANWYIGRALHITLSDIVYEIELWVTFWKYMLFNWIESDSTSSARSAWPVMAKNRQQLDKTEVRVICLPTSGIRAAFCPIRDLLLPVCVHLVICCPL